MNENKRKELERKIREWQNGANHFTAMLFELLSKADITNTLKLKHSFPDEVEIYEEWMKGEGDEHPANK